MHSDETGLRHLLLLLGIPVIWAALLSGQVTQGETGGRVVERVIAAHDSSQSYALFLPTGYDSLVRRPLLIVMDPRGRGMVGIELFRRAADRHGWVVMSSYNTASDVPAASNIVAINAILGDAERMPVNLDRLYLAGFSGTARLAWELGFELNGRVPGVIGVGAGLAQHRVWTDSLLAESPFDFFGISGVRDFNHDEMRYLDARLERLGVRHRLDVFDGGHQWPPPRLTMRAVEWLELNAMRRGLRPADGAWIRRTYEARASRADSLERAGQLTEAYRELAMSSADYAPWQLDREAQARAAELARNRKVRRTLARESELLESAATYTIKMGYLWSRGRATRNPPSLADLSRLLRLDSLRTAAQDTDSLARTSAERLLELVFVYAAGYEATAFFESGRPSHALALLDLAETIKPGTRYVCVRKTEAQGMDSVSAAAKCGDLRPLTVSPGFPAAEFR